MRLSRFVLPAVLSMVLLPSAASASANKEHLQLMAEIRMLQEQQQQLQGLLGALQSPQAASPAPAGLDPLGPAAGAPPSQPPPSTMPAGTSPQRMYETSLDDYMAGRLDLAIQGFQSFVQAFPRAPQTGTAVYNIGMSYYGLNKWPEARDAFLKVINDYPQAQGTVVPDAYYKLGQTYERLNQVENAKKAYEAAVQKFPGNP